jgi:hypothetical protein
LLAGPFVWKWTVERTLALGCIATVLTLYLAYAAFDDWWYLRFLLPAIPLLMILAADAVAAFSPTRIRAMVLALFTLFAASAGVRFASAHGVWSVAGNEQRYADMASYIATVVPANAVVFAVQHSGTIRYYAGRLTARYDEFDAESLDRAVEDLSRMHRRVFLVLDHSEEPVFRDRFASARAGSVLATPPLAVVDNPTGVSLYALDSTGASVERPVRIPRLPPGTCLPPASNYPLDVR